MTIRAAIYLRQSVDPDGRAAAVQRQREDCVALASARGWVVVAEHVDNDTSATARRRPGFEAMMSAADGGAYDVIVAWHVDRLVRRLADLEPVMATCQALRIQIATVTGELDPSTDTGRLIARILSSVAQAEVERKAARQARANRQRAEQGIVRLVRRPFGYDLTGRIQRREANALRWAATRLLEDGATFAQVARDLNSRGIRTSAGGTWRASSLTKVMRNPRYAGVATYHGQPVATGTWTPILSLDVHLALAARVQALSPQVNPGPRRRHLLSGIAVCGICGAPVGVNVDGRTGRLTYRCPRLHLSRRLDAVDETVRDALFEHLLHLVHARDVERSGLDAATRKGLGSAGRSHPRRSLAAHWQRLSLGERRELVQSLAAYIRIDRAGRGYRFTPAQLRIQWKEAGAAAAEGLAGSREGATPTDGGRSTPHVGEVAAAQMG